MFGDAAGVIISDAFHPGEMIITSAETKDVDGASYTSGDDASGLPAYIPRAFPKVALFGEGRRDVDQDESVGDGVGC